MKSSKKENPALKVPDYTHCPVELLHMMMMICDDDHGAAKYIFGPFGSLKLKLRRYRKQYVLTLKLNMN